MAVLGMDQYAHLLASRVSRGVVVSSRAEIDAAYVRGQLPVRRPVGVAVSGRSTPALVGRDERQHCRVGGGRTASRSSRGGEAAGCAWCRARGCALPPGPSTNSGARLPCRGRRDPVVESDGRHCEPGLRDDVVARLVGQPPHPRQVRDMVDSLAKRVDTIGGDEAGPAAIAGGAANADDVGAGRVHALDVVSAQPAGERSESPSGLQPGTRTSPARAPTSVP